VTRPPDEAKLRAAIRDGYGFDILGLEVESHGVDAAAGASRAQSVERPARPTNVSQHP